jgi:hypothetical protein
MIHFNISMPGCSKWPLALRVFYQNVLRASHRPIHATRFGHLSVLHVVISLHDISEPKFHERFTEG